MKMIAVIALALVACVAAAPASGPEPQLLNFQSDQSPEGSYNFGFSIDNNINRQETGQLKTVQDEENKPRNVIVISGSYTQLDAEGKPQTINYFADETGYHAEGPAVPKAARR